MRVGPAKSSSDKVKMKKTDTTKDEDSDFALPSEFDETNDEDLAHFLRSNTSFLVNMHATGAFSVSWQILYNISIHF